MTTLNHKKIASWAIILVVMVFGLVMTNQASAKNAHQDHRGACARSTSNITKGVGDLRYNGVLNKVASKLGIRSVDGNVTKQMRNQLVVGRVARATRTNNHGCTGTGQMFGAGRRQLYKGEAVAVRVPAKYGKDARSGPAKGYHKVTIKVSVILPISCWNLNTGTVWVDIWVKNPPPAKAKPKPVAPKPSPAPVTVSCPSGSTWNGASCVVQTNTAEVKQSAEQACKANVNGTWNGNQCVIIQNTTIIQVNATCSKVVVNLSDGTVQTTFKDSNGNVVNENYCTTQVVTPPPVVPPTPPAPKVTKIVSTTTLNDIPTGKSSGPVYITTYSSESGGMLTVDPGIGAVSRCNSNVPTGSVTFLSLPAGNSDSCVIFYAPSDPAKPTTMTVSMTAMLGSSVDVKSQTFGITYPVRP